MKILIIVALLLCSRLGWAAMLPDKFGGDEQKEEGITIYLSQADLEKLNKGRSVYRWRGEGDKFMDEVRPPRQSE